MPLLDEAAELLGEDERTVQARARRERRRRIAYARGVLDLAYGSRSVDLVPEEEAEILSAYDILDAERLASRYEEDDDRTAVERAAADRTWAFGHIVVDEAQELSPMAWRMLLRRCPSRSMTIVGDMAQASELGGGSSWQQVLGPNLGDRYRMERLTINYRTPAEIAEVAADTIPCIAIDSEPSHAAPRSGRPGSCPGRRRRHRASLVRPARRASPAKSRSRHQGWPPGRHRARRPPRRTDPRGRRRGPGRGARRPVAGSRPVVVLSVKQVRGLEFDSGPGRRPGAHQVADS